MKYQGTTDELLLLTEINPKNCFLLKEKVESGLTILWNIEETSKLRIDGVEHELSPNSILFLTEFHKVEVIHVGLARLIRFNRPFYCISTHDSEVSCKGLLFFGASQVPEIVIPKDEIDKYELLWQMFQMEMREKDNLQSEMLQMMLKRFIILSTRIFKYQNEITSSQNELNLIREFNYLVEVHFKKLHKVSDYADLLYKSPKTLSNVFAQYYHKSPLQIIKERRMLEAKRNLNYTDLSVSDIAFQLGYEDIQSFSRFFKSQEGVSPKDFREQTANREKLLTN
jgi:AraC-like DNA-binding protein